MIATELGREVRVGLLSTGLLFPIAAGMIARSLGDGATELGGAVEREARACDATRLDAACEDGERCVAGRCLPMRSGAPAGAQAGCDGRTCALGFDCHQQRCQPVQELQRRVAPAVCRDDEVRPRLNELLLRCAQARRGAPSLLTDCDAGDWRQMSQAKDFVDLVVGMPGAFPVFFPTGQPDREGRWPGVEVRERYLDGVRRLAAALQRGQAILVFGRASASGGAALNFELAERRAGFVRGLIKEELAEAAPRLHAWGLAADFPLSVEAMRRWMPERPIAHDEAAARELAALREPGRASERWSEASEMVNRVVFVVPLPCDGDEFIPDPAYRGRGKRSRSSP